jgi:hypothetical protein
MLKNCIKVPKVENEEEEEDQDSSSSSDGSSPKQAGAKVDENVF